MEFRNGDNIVSDCSSTSSHPHYYATNSLGYEIHNYYYASGSVSQGFYVKSPVATNVWVTINEGTPTKYAVPANTLTYVGYAYGTASTNPAIAWFVMFE